MKEEYVILFYCIVDPVLCHSRLMLEALQIDLLSSTLKNAIKLWRHFLYIY